MHPKVEAYIQEKAAKRKEIYQAEKQLFLCQENFTDFIPNPDPDAAYTDEYPNYVTDPETGKGTWGKYVSIEITDEEYELLRAASEQTDTSNRNKVAAILQGIAYAIYTLAGLAALILFFSGDENLWPFAFASLATGLISGTSFLGFAEIIKLLHRINGKLN